MKPLPRPTGVSHSSCLLSGEHAQADNSDELLPVTRATDAIARGPAE